MYNSASMLLLWTLYGLEMDCGARQIQKIAQGLYIMRENNESKIEQQYM
jgi:hypothetical protein